LPASQNDAGRPIRPKFKFGRERQLSSNRGKELAYSNPSDKIPSATRPNRSLRIIPLGGSGEDIGKNMVVYEYGQDIIVIDAGIQFPGADMPGIDYVICDTTYLEKNRARVKGYFITHGHEDHIGGLPYVWPKIPAPIYAAPLTAGLIKSKFEEHAVNNYQLRIIQPGEDIVIGGFRVKPIHLTHSIPDLLGLAITTAAGRVFHATDWKIDFTPPFGGPTDFAALSRLSDEGIDCLLSDSTNVMTPGYTISEAVVAQAIKDIFIRTKGRIIVSSFASRIDRIQHVLTASHLVGRKVAISGRSMEENINIAMGLGYLKVPQGTLVDIRTINALPSEKTVVMCTGSQGEEFSALVRMATGEHRHIQLKKGDTVLLSSSSVPGNERAISATINNLYRQGAEVITNKQLDIHSSGHANREEIKLMVSLLKPKNIMPIHGDYRSLVEHTKLAQEVGVSVDRCFVVENGQILEINHREAKISQEKVTVGQVLIDGLGVGDVGQVVLRDRQTMAEDGMFLVVITVEKKTGKLLTSPDIISRGFVYMKESEGLIQEARALIKKAHLEHTGNKTFNWEYLKKALREDLGEFLFKKTERRPIVIPVVIEV